MSIYGPEKWAKHVLVDDMYSGLLDDDPTDAATKTILDYDYAFLYAQNFCSHLSRLINPGAGNVLDMGCGAGAVSQAFHRLLDVPVCGVDMSPAAITYAKQTFPGPDFINGSADELSSIEENSLAFVHAREFYPFSRTNDTELHMRFLRAARPKLITGGLFCIVQIREPSIGDGIHVNLHDVQARAHDAGFKRYGKMIMVPQFFYRRFGKLGQFAPVAGAISVAGRCLEMLQPGRVTYIYWFQR